MQSGMGKGKECVERNYRQEGENSINQALNGERERKVNGGGWGSGGE
jgi:hypothetical protein